VDLNLEPLQHLQCHPDALTIRLDLIHEG